MTQIACPDASQPQFVVSLAAGSDDVAAAQRLRYAVFVQELGGDGDLVDHVAGREADRFDGHCDHLLLRDMARPPGDEVVGVYRLLREGGARAAGGFYTEAEFDLRRVLGCGRRLLELGRSCLHPEYRGGMAMYHLWTGLAAYVEHHEVELMFGTASFHGTRIDRLAEPLSILHYRHLAPPGIRVRARAPGAAAMDLLPAERIDRARAMRAVPALIKAYLRLGGTIGEGAWIDHRFNTTDVCLLLDTTRLSDRARVIYAARRA